MPRFAVFATGDGTVSIMLMNQFLEQMHYENLPIILRLAIVNAPRRDLVFDVSEQARGVVDYADRMKYIDEKDDLTRLEQRLEQLY